MSLDPAVEEHNLKLFRMRLSNLVYERKEDTGKTQEDQAKDIDISPPEFSKLIRRSLSKSPNSPPKPRADTLMRIADYYNVSTDYLLGLSEHRHPICADRDKLISQICIYTGLTPKAVEFLHQRSNDYLYRFCISYLLSQEKLISNIVEYILACLYDVVAKDKRYSLLLEQYASYDENSKHLFYDIIEELPRFRTFFHDLICKDKKFREKCSREMALKIIDFDKVMWAYQSDREEFVPPEYDAYDEDWFELPIELSIDESEEKYWDLYNGQVTQFIENHPNYQAPKEINDDNNNTENTE